MRPLGSKLILMQNALLCLQNARPICEHSHSTYCSMCVTQHVKKVRDFLCTFATLVSFADFKVCLKLRGLNSYSKLCFGRVGESCKFDEDSF